MNKVCPRPSEDDPGILVDWHIQAVEMFVQGVNLNPFLIPKAGFINTAPGKMTIRSFQSDIVTQLARIMVEGCKCPAGVEFCRSKKAKR
jgi:hypothetical protein